MRGTGESRRTQVAGVQYMRALAALFVVYFHTTVYDAQFAWPEAIPRGFGAGGVDMFFVISGFIMMLVTGSRATTPATFLRRRVLRVVPLYWCITLAVAGLALVYPAALLENVVTGPHLALSLLFLPHANPLSGNITPFYKIGWTLNYEMYFYVLFALCLTLRSPARRLALLAGYAALVSAVFLAIDPRIAAVRVYTNPIICEFVLGAAIGHLHLSGRLARMGRGASLGCGASFACGALGLAALLACPVDDATRLFLQAVPAATLLCGLLGLEAAGRLPRVDWLLLLGDASYSIYLAHPVVETLFRLATRSAHLPVGAPAVGAAATALAVAVSVLAGVSVHRLLEVPLLRALGSGTLPGVARARLRAARPAVVGAEPRTP